MCGRFTLAADEQQLVEAFDIPTLTFDFQPSYNVAPGQSTVVVAADGAGRRAGQLKWGFVPGWLDQPGSGFINARSESVADKPSFREAFARRRCLVPADGFYEWRRDGDAKVPHWFHPSSASPVAFGGIWESWSRPDQEPKHTFAILTTAANEDVRGVHDRMPLVISPRAFSVWLDRNAQAAEVQSLLRSAPDGTFDVHPVTDRVNRPSENDVGLTEPTKLPVVRPSGT
ncbi:MAG: SOS response-associated peptidase [Gemmatimonadales bacterium]|jgi:putative SOS response-associated peptidase YedK|nr:SOS response-associated peptidase [Gemmatimonadales bacterium]MBT3497699.1 SOS response-associated peptidase [Gemmatimonadales bacterium]MBT3774720.1 SOS response-associated peptidase [Gemmatimonadales bacterium]MBT3959119.1 SOS response-associated peptidase [Gemmatimonadales bacterium]MBT4188295.1 SOS response-associated peptidase [Gemmatimonadales bacterium]